MIATNTCRFVAQRGERFATNLQRIGHRYLGDFERHIVKNLDGNRDKPALLRLLADLVSTGEVTVEKDGRLVHEPARIEEMIATALDSQLATIAKNALLVR